MATKRHYQVVERQL